MAIAFVNSTSQRATGTSISFTSYNLSTSNLVLVFLTNWTDNNDNFTGVTVGGNAMTRITGASGAGTNIAKFRAAYYITGQSGTQTITISASPSTDTFAVVMTYSGTLQNASVIDASTNGDKAIGTTSYALALTTTATQNCWGVSYGHTEGETLTGYTTGSIREATTGYFKGADSNGSITPSSTYTGTWSTAASTRFAQILVSIAPALPAAANGNFLAFM